MDTFIWSTFYERYIFLKGYEWKNRTKVVLSFKNKSKCRFVKKFVYLNIVFWSWSKYFGYEKSQDL